MTVGERAESWLGRESLAGHQVQLRGGGNERCSGVAGNCQKWTWQGGK